MRPAPDPKMNMGVEKFEILEKGIRHVEVIVLTCMYNNRLCPVLIFQRMVKGCNFDEVGSGRSDEMDEHEKVPKVSKVR